jgi:hypothetical protein
MFQRRGPATGNEQSTTDSGQQQQQQQLWKARSKRCMQPLLNGATDVIPLSTSLSRTISYCHSQM